MIWFIGDTHGDLRRFSHRALGRMTRADTLVVCGDFGFVWRGGPEEQAALEKIGRMPFTTLFLTGTNDNMDLLAAYPVEEVCGAPARHLSGRLWQLQRGEIYTIGDKTLLAMGGGESRDFALREIGVNWWPQEIPTEAEVARCRENVKAHGGRVDYIATHQAPTSIDACVTNSVCDVTCLTALMDALQRDCAFTAWYFGYYHRNRFIPPRYFAVYDKKVAAQ